MAKTFRTYLPEQNLLLPASLREWLPDDHLAYFVSDVVGHFVVERTPRLVGHLCLPIHTAAAGRAGGVIDGLNQTTADPEATQRRRRKEVLKITDVVQARSAAVVEVVDQPHHSALLCRH